MEAGIGEFLAGDAAGDADAAEAECFDGVFNLLRGEIGVLQGGGGEGDEAVGVGGAEFHQRFVLDLYQFGGDVAFGAVPVGVDAEGFHVDALRVHRGDAGAGVGHQQAGCFERMVDQRRGGRDDAVGVDVDGLDAFAVDHDLAAPRLFGWRRASTLVIAQPTKAMPARALLIMGISVSPLTGFLVVAGQDTDVLRLLRPGEHCLLSDTGL